VPGIDIQSPPWASATRPLILGFGLSTVYAEQPLRRQRSEQGLERLDPKETLRSK
jgi:hypothetical protein